MRCGAAPRKEEAGEGLKLPILSTRHSAVAVSALTRIRYAAAMGTISAPPSKCDAQLAHAGIQLSRHSPKQRMSMHWEHWRIKKRQCMRQHSLRSTAALANSWRISEPSGGGVCWGNFYCEAGAKGPIAASMHEHLARMLS